MKLFELDPNNPIDRELQKTASSAASDGSLDPNDIEAQGDEEGGMDPAEDPMGGPENAPDGPMSNAPPPEPEPPQNPVDSALMAKVQNHDYIQGYSHTDENAKTDPVTIMNLDMSELSDLRKRIRVHMDRIGMADRVGSYSDPDTKAAQDMLSFVDIVMMHKKQDVKTAAKASPSRPAVRKPPESKVKPGQQFKHKQQK